MKRQKPAPTLTLDVRRYYGEKPWIARITGTHGRFGLAREFMHGATSSSRSGKTGSTTLILAHGLYQTGGGRSVVRDIGEYFLVCEGTDDQGKPATVREEIDAERALTMAVKMDQGADFDTARRETADED